MKKIPTLFKREFDEHHKITNTLPEVIDGMEWVLNGEGVATVKYDGSCCAIIGGKFYLRYDAKNGKPIPDGAIKCQEEADPITGHLPCWIPYNPDDKGMKWYFSAYKNYIADHECEMFVPKDGTYEAIGLHFNGNMYKMNDDILVPHGQDIIKDCPRTFEGIRDYLKDHFIEGIVFWKDGEPKCKIKRSDFGFEWQPKKRK